MRKSPALAVGSAALVGALVFVAQPASSAPASGNSRRSAAVSSTTASDRALLPDGFTESKVRTNGVRINYVRGGHGPTLVLIHGYPETWYMWHQVLPELAKHYTVIAPDLRGAGGSDAPVDGYDKKTMAEDIHGLLTRLGLNHEVNLVGHDIGTMVAYAYAAAHPDEVKKLALTEAPIPDKSVYTFTSLTPEGPGFWNFGFFSLKNGLPEQTIDGRETEWVEGFVDTLEVRKNAVSPEEAAVYGKALRDDAHLRASFEWFRALPDDIADNKVNIRTKLTMPILALGASGSLRDSVLNQARRYGTDVTGGVVADSGHWIWEEQPAEATRLLLTFLDD